MFIAAPENVSLKGNFTPKFFNLFSCDDNPVNRITGISHRKSVFHRLMCVIYWPIFRLEIIFHICSVRLKLKHGVLVAYKLTVHIRYVYSLWYTGLGVIHQGTAIYQTWNSHRAIILIKNIVEYNFLLSKVAFICPIGFLNGKAFFA